MNSGHRLAGTWLSLLGHLTGFTFNVTLRFSLPISLINPNSTDKLLNKGVIQIALKKQRELLLLH